VTTTILSGDCRDILHTLPAQSVHCVVTSPPYFGLRDYGTVGQLGLEETPAEYVAALVEVFREVRRVLRPDGTCWLNLGDSYAANRSYQVTPTKYKSLDFGKSNANKVPEGLKPKDLIGIPWRVAFALQEDGWYLRSDIIWAKPNPMPESVTDRPTKSHEYIFLLTKSERYFYDHLAIKEKSTGREIFGNMGKKVVINSDRNDQTSQNLEISETRNKRTVWTVATKPYSGAHFATFPEKLVEPCILAGCPSRACEHCGAAWKRIAQRSRVTFKRGFDPSRITGRAGFNRERPGLSDTYVLGIPQSELAGNLRVAATGRLDEMRNLFGSKWDHWTRTDEGGARVPTFEDAKQLADLLGIEIPFDGQAGGLRPGCKCPGNTGSGVGTVLDPFGGSGTVGAVAKRMGRHSVLIELNPDYLPLIEERTSVQ
jgi:DNA modification methylase